MGKPACRRPTLFPTLYKLYGAAKNDFIVKKLYLADGGYGAPQPSARVGQRTRRHKGIRTYRVVYSQMRAQLSVRIGEKEHRKTGTK